MLVGCTEDSGGAPPCTPLAGYDIDPCEPGTGTISKSQGSGAFMEDQPFSLRLFLDNGAFAKHIVLRGTYLPDTVRCEGKSYTRLPKHPEGGDEGLRVNCFADIRVNEYFLGSGPTSLTVVALSWPSFFVFNEADTELAARNLESVLVEGGWLVPLHVPPGGIGGREKVMLLGPARDYAFEAWQIFQTLDLERQSDDTVKIVHPHLDYWQRQENYETLYQSNVEWTPAQFTKAIVAADATRREDYDGRSGDDSRDPMLVTNAANLRDIHVETGNVNHPDGPPAPPPPACGLAVPDYIDNPGLMRDCFALLAAKDTLRGTGTLNWSVDEAIADWDGVTVAGTPQRVTKLELANKSLTGSIPASLGKLDLTTLKLADNSLTGCIPVALRDVPTNDLDDLARLPPCP